MFGWRRNKSRSRERRMEQCLHCGRDSNVPVYVEPVNEHFWRVQLRCFHCEVIEEADWPNDACERYDEYLSEKDREIIVFLEKPEEEIVRKLDEWIASC